jgi:hypothetical protein
MFGYAKANSEPAKRASTGDAEHLIQKRAETPAASDAGADTDSQNLNPTARSLLQLREALDESADVQSHLTLQRAFNKRTAKPVQRKPNATGLPDHLKAGVEHLSGLAMDDVRVHYNSPKPAAVQAHAYAHGTDIHIGPGQQQHLPHEAWHVVQQKQGRVKPTLQLKGVAINDDMGLEREADVMAGRALQRRVGASSVMGPFSRLRSVPLTGSTPVQALMDLKEVKADKATVGYIKQNYMKILSAYHELLEMCEQDPDNNQNVALITENPILIGQILGESKLPDELQNAYNAADLLNIVQLMNVMERDAQAGKMSARAAGTEEDDASDVKIGTEFTFTTKALEQLSMDHKQAADPFMQKWTSFVSAQAHLKPKVENATGGSVKYPKFAKTFTYTLSNKATWWWRLDIDEACLETQTQPSTLAQFQSKHGEIRKIIDRDIFGAARAVGLVPGGGGGHISIDSATTFGGSGEQMLVLLRQLQEKSDLWDKNFGQTTEGDKLNSAWIGEMTPLKPFLAETERLLSAVIVGELDMFGAVRALMDFNTKLKNPVAENFKTGKAGKTSQEKAALKKAGTAVAREPHHYQAVNIEHLDEKEAKESRRLELRRIGSQKDAAELVEHIEFIFKLVNEARLAVSDRIKKRLPQTAAAGTGGAATNDMSANAANSANKNKNPDKKK